MEGVLFNIAGRGAVAHEAQTWNKATRDDAVDERGQDPFPLQQRPPHLSKAIL